ncbi:MAG: zinc-ribbon domain-containing protein [Bacteroidales bacterium]|nr:zinc-ribbon domain-containing protein [Bacteroidales bacterium]
MALIYCRECGAKISDKALVCPKCGAAQISIKTILEDDVILKSDSSNTSKESNSWIKWLIVGVVAGLLIFLGVTYYPKLFQQNNEDDMLLAEWDQELNDNNFNNNNRINGHEYVDLGLSVKWATCNVGATQPHEYGDYYAWGETTTKNEYTSRNSKTFGDCDIKDISGNRNYDVVTANLGNGWRMPTEEEMKELETKCTWVWETKNGINGYKIIGPNGNSIFLPAAGYKLSTECNYAGEYGLYWSSTPYDIFSNYACFLCFSNGRYYVDSHYRSVGHTIRPVAD